MVGKGAFSSVIMVRHLKSGRLFAMKLIDKNSINVNIYKQLLTERIALSVFNSPFIVKLHWAFQSRDHLHLVEELCPGGELFFHMKRIGYFSEEIAKFYFAEVVLGLENIHSNGII